MFVGRDRVGGRCYSDRAFDIEKYKKIEGKKNEEKHGEGEKEKKNMEEKKMEERKEEHKKEEEKKEEKEDNFSENAETAIDLGASLVTGTQGKIRKE